MSKADIALFVGADGWWQARFIRDAEQVIREFGTDTLPTAFSARVGAFDVVPAIRALNPGQYVVAYGAGR